MKKKNIIVIMIGFMLLLLGLLWFLQGSDQVHIKPILCFANCQPITGKSTIWQITGAIVFIVGAVIIFKNFKKQEKV